jgi:hypothetical protein
LANPPFQVDGPPYPTDLPFYQTEALSWFRNNKEEAEESEGENISIATVKKLYSAGAARVDVVVRPNQSGSNLSELEVTFPDEGVRRLLAVVKSLKPENFETMRGEGIEDPYADDGSFAGEAVTLSWD